MIVPIRTAIGSIPSTDRSGDVSFSFPCGDRVRLRDKDYIVLRAGLFQGRVKNLMNGSPASQRLPYLIYY